MHGPLPKRIFGNEDGKLYSRGFFAMVIGFVCMLAPWILEAVWGAITGMGTAWSGRGHGGLFMFVGLSTMNILPAHHRSFVLRDAVLVGGLHAHERVRRLAPASSSARSGP